MPKVMRYQVADYLGITTTSGGSSTTAYYLMGTGFTKIDEEANPKIDTKAYVSDKGSSSTVTGYERTFPYEFDHIKSQEAIDALYAVGHDDKIGEAAEFDYVRVDLYDAAETTGSYTACKWKVCAEVGTVGGEGGELMTGSGTLHAIGDAIAGTFAVATKTFTANA